MTLDELPVLSGRIPTAARAWQHDTDVIIIGSGAAGLSAAVRLLDAGRRVTMITKGSPGDGSTAWAQGGLAAVLGTADSVQSHLADTLTAGVGLCETGPVRDLVNAAPAVIERLVALGARFDQDQHDEYALGLEGGHSARRIVHAGGDASGAEVSRTLVDAVRRRSATLSLREQTTVVDLITEAGTVVGARVIDDHGRIGEITAPVVVLASGGIGQAWDSTTNPDSATGDGLALALRAGAVLRDVEFVQFHPTVLVVPENHRRPGDRGVLISEAVRGEGARLVDRHGALVMDGRHPLGDLAPRDVVSSTMHAQLMASGDDHLFLDGTRLGATTWRDHFPSILALCRARGVDPVTEPIPVRPAEHYSCGGVLASLSGVTTVPGLYAVGEVASTGVQGANRLASNSLTEALVAGDRVGQLLVGSAAGWHGPLALEASSGCASLPDEFQTPDPPRDQCPEDAARADGAVRADNRSSIVAAVSRGAGVLRDESGLSVLLKTLADTCLSGTAADLADVEATNLHTVATVVAAAGLRREESRGCHRRADYPVTDPQWQRHSLVRLGSDGLLISPSEEI
jgi:L-aspartate oxidase